MSLAGSVARLEAAIDAARSLGLDTSHAELVRRTVDERLRFAGDTYVLALAGGTGVGKSSLLNAIAGTTVSRAAARRPTTSEPLAWVPSAARAELAPLLAWVGVKETHEHDDPRARGVAVIDLPDLDSIAPENRAHVDALLPRIDAVIWVVDPEKYQDAIIHDAYFREWVPRLARQVIVLNKADRLSVADADRLREDLAARLRANGLPAVPIVLSSATEAEAGIAQVRDWIAEAADAKRIVAERLTAEATAATRSLAESAGVSEDSARLVGDERRSLVLADVTREALALVDVRGLERQAVAATRLAARPRGAGPMGHLTAAVYRWSGRASVAADPAAFLRRWRDRGSLARPAEPVRALVSDVLAAVPPAARPAVAALGEPGALQSRIGDALDRATAAVADTLVTPRSMVWALFGAGQYVVTALLLFGALWLAVIMFAQVPVAAAVVPVLGPVPTPLLVVAAAALAGYILARLLGAHAGWVGRRWARRIRDAVSAGVASRLRTELLAPLDTIDAARERLRLALAPDGD